MNDNVIKTPYDEFRISQEIHEDNQEWRQHLVLVSSLPHRFVGISPLPYTSKMNMDGQPFTLYGALAYYAELAFSPIVDMTRGPDGPVPVLDEHGQPKILGIRGNTKLHVLVPYDLLGVAEIEIVNYQNLLWACRQPKEFQSWLYREYLNFFDPPKVQRIQGA